MTGSWLACIPGVMDAHRRLLNPTEALDHCK